MNENIEIKLFETAKEFLIKRFPKEWGGVTAAITDKNRILTSIAPSIHNPSVELCIETGTILEAFKYDEKITHIITIARDDENAEIKILSPCGVCQERLSYLYLYQEDVVESGFDMADLKVDSTSADSFISSVGLNLTYDGVISSTPVRPMTFVRYEHDWSAAKDSTHDVNAGFNLKYLW